MDKRLVEAARVGDIMALNRIMEEDPQVLEKASLVLSADSPLHVAALSGRVDFVKQMIRLMASLAMHTNQEGLIPLHMASAQGHFHTVRELLKAKLDDDEDDEVMMMTQCLVKDNEGRTPLHYAVFRGRIGVIKELVSHSPECVEEVTAKGENVLHLAVKANQVKTMGVMLESLKRLPNFQTLLKAKDFNGKTVYDLAATKKQFLVILDKAKEEKDEIKEETNITVEVEEDDNDGDSAPKKNKEKKVASADFKNTVLVVATLIITLTYQGLANPPSTLFQPGTKIDWKCLSPNYFSPKYLLFPSIKIDKICPAYSASLFLVINSIIFIQSIFLLLSNLSGAHGFLLILRLLALFLTYNYCVLLNAFTVYTEYFTSAIYWLSTVFLLYLLISERIIKDKLMSIWRNPRHCVYQLKNCILFRK